MPKFNTTHCPRRGLSLDAVVGTVPSGNLNPPIVEWTKPATSSFEFGPVVPIPTFPAESTLRSARRSSATRANRDPIAGVSAYAILDGRLVLIRTGESRELDSMLEEVSGYSERIMAEAQDLLGKQ